MTTRVLSILLILASCFLLLPPLTHAQVDPNLRQRLQQNALIFDHTDIVPLDEIPDTYVQKARDITFTYQDRSVGDNINNYLTCAQHDWAHQTTSSCKRDLTEATYGIPYDNYFLRTNWEFIWSDANLWDETTTYFFTSVVPTRTTQQVLNFQISYLSVMDSSFINDEPGTSIRTHSPGYFYGYPNVANRYDISDVEQLQADRPNQLFFHWTTSLARTIGTNNSTVFNNRARQYAIENHQALFDYADIMSHTPTGEPCTSGAYPALCDEYTDETSGGHLNAFGGMRIARAMWLFMAQIAGWQPGTTQPTITPSSPTPTPIPGNMDGDTDVDYLDLRLFLPFFNTSNSLANFNRIGLVDIFDWNILIRNL